MNKQMRLDPFGNVANSGVAVTDMNKFLGSVLEKITLILGGTFTRSMITLIELKANGKVIFQTTGANIESVNLYQGATTAATVCKIDLMDRRAVTPNARQAGTIDLSAKSGITSLRLEVTISGATSPTLTGFCDVAPPTEDPNEAGIRWLMTRKHRATVVIGAAGTFAIPVPHLDPAGGGSNFRRIVFYSANMTGFKTVREGVTEHELNSVAEINTVAQDNFKVPQASVVVFDPVQDGQLTGRTWDTRPASGV
ncbi:MAG: major capsid protein P2, partial [Pseudomonadota bacterium]